VDRFSEACCGKGVDPVDSATAGLIAREAAQRRAEPWKSYKFTVGDRIQIALDVLDTPVV